MTKKSQNPILQHAKILNKINPPPIFKIPCSILFSVGCRTSECLQFQFQKSIQDFTYVSIPIKKKRKQAHRTIPIKHKLFELTPQDFEELTHRITSRTLQTFLKKYFRFTARDYRHTLALYVLNAKNIMFVKDLLCHEDIKTTQHYLTGERVDYHELLHL